MSKSIAFEILNRFLNSRYRYKGISVNALGFPTQNKNRTKKSFSTEFSRLKHNKYVQQKGDRMYITPKGQEYVKRRRASLSNFNVHILKTVPKNLMVMFDIPESRKSEREWFRFHLKKFNFDMI